MNSGYIASLYLSNRDTFTILHQDGEVEEIENDLPPNETYPISFNQIQTSAMGKNDSASKKTSKATKEKDKPAQNKSQRQN